MKPLLTTLAALLIALQTAAQPLYTDHYYRRFLRFGKEVPISAEKLFLMFGARRSDTTCNTL